MKKLFLFILVFLPILCGAIATAEEAEITAVLQRAGVSQPVQLGVWGDTAACFAETDRAKRLILLEKQEGAWRVTVDNPTALLPDYDWPELWLDSDGAIYWTYILPDQQVLRYHSARTADGSWGPVDQYFADSSLGHVTYERNTFWDAANGGEIIRELSASDENDNSLGTRAMEYLPASWLGDCVRLADFDVSRFPTMIVETNDYFASENERFFREAAGALMPEDTFVKGMLKEGALHFLTEKPDGSRAYLICEYASRRQANLIESAPLPADTALGYENFTDSLRIGDCCVTVRLLASGKVGIEYIYNDTPDDGEAGFLFFGENAVWDDAQVPAQTLLYGSHPWNDIAQADWDSLPLNLAEAAQRVDGGGYAMVLNPNPADRLNLREQPDKGSSSLVKYYTGTPVQILSEEGDWAQVRIGPATKGWMMKRYLIWERPGEALRLDLSALPQLYAAGEMLRVYAEPQNGEYSWHTTSSLMKIIGAVGEAWYHVWFPETGEYGFVRQSDLTSGNG